MSARSSAVVFVTVTILGVISACSGGNANQTKQSKRVPQSSSTTIAQGPPPVGPEQTSSGPRLVTARLVAATPSSVSLDNGATYPLGPATQICRGGCSATWEALQPGDRVQVDVNGADPARFININPWADEAQIDEIDGSRLVVHTTRYSAQSRPQYTVLIGPDTRINLKNDGTAVYVGSYPSATVGREIQVLGSTQEPDDSSVVLATTING
jgi:hypothetical protein